MDKLLIYLGESIAVLALFYCTYYLALRKGINHRLSRYFLLASLLLALILPFHFINVTWSFNRPVPARTISIVENVRHDYQSAMKNVASKQPIFNAQRQKISRQKSFVTENLTPASTRQIPINYTTILFWLYITGVALLLVRFCKQLMLLTHQTKKQDTQKINNIIYVYFDEEISPYSFGNYLFAPKSIIDDPRYHSVLEHEKAHILQKHTNDVIFIELISIFFWINPFVWLTKSSLRKVHEYLADEHVIRKGHNSLEYQEILLEKTLTPKLIALSSTFHFKPLKQRLTMIRNLSKTMSNRFNLLRRIPALIAVTLSLLIGFILSCDNTKDKAFQLVKIQGITPCYNSSTSSFGYLLYADDSIPTTMLAAEGDIIVADEILFTAGSQTEYKFSSPAQGILYDHDKVFSITLSDKESTLEWLQQLNSIDLSSLDNIYINKKLPENYMEILQAISNSNPNIGLYIEKWSDELLPVLSLFNLNWLGFNEFNATSLTALHPLPAMKSLMLPFDNMDLTEPLPAFPNLKNLTLTEIDIEQKIIPNLFINNPQIETLNLYDCEPENYSFLNELDHLHSLTLLNTESDIDIDFLNDLKAIKRLSIITDKVAHWDVLEKTNKLEWLVICGDISQEEFDNTIKANTKLQVVELIECDYVNDYSTLGNLKKLKAFTVSDTLRDGPNTLQLSNLEYISLPAKALEDSIFTSNLAQANPNGVIVPNDGFCMGSGWLILFLPAMFLLAWLRRKKTLLKWIRP